MIDFGAHPNQQSLFLAMSQAETDEETNFTVGILWASPDPILLTVRMAIAVAVGALTGCGKTLVFSSSLG
jgi:hypothetical protein